MLTLGDRGQAARLTNEAVDAAIERLATRAELRHPERAAAWLRARVVARYRPGRRRSPADEAQRAAALRDLGIDERVGRALSALTRKERAALIADAVERFDPLDTGTIVLIAGRRVASTRRRARQRYAAAFTALASNTRSPGDGPLAHRLREIAARALP
jgi:DNA-directed RNA polymerase specialized sigma24 family protein